MPDWIAHLRPRLAPLKLSATREAEIIEELSQHLDERYDQLRAEGESDTEALRLTLAELRETEALARYMRPLRQAHVPPPITPGASSGSVIADLRQDLGYAARMLRRQPGFAAAAVLTLALGVGATTAIFSLINATVLRPLPFPDPDRLVAIWARNPGQHVGTPFASPANADVAEWRRTNQSFAGIAAFAAGSADLAEGGAAERVGAAGVTAGFFETLGVTPLLGRTLAPGEEVHGGPLVALIGHGLWLRRFGGDPSLVGRRVWINGAARTIIGILPPDFDFPRGAEWPSFFPFAGRTEVWLPLAFRAQDDGTGWSNWQSRHERGLVAIGRVKGEASLGQAQAEMETFATHAAQEYPATHKGWGIALVPLRDQMAGQSSTSLLVLFAAVSLLLLIACVNVANLLLARGVARQQEIAVRTALGAGRRRLVRQLLAESLLLSTLAGAFAVLVAYACLRVFLRLNPLTYSRLDEASIDPAGLGFAAGLALVTSVMFGLVPALQSSRADLRTSLHEGGRSGDGAVRERVRAWLVAAEVALALVLLTTAGLMVRSFLRVQAVQPGFRPEGVLAFDVSAGPRDEASQFQFFEQLTAGLQALPGVRAAGAISFLPLGGGQNRGSFVVEGDPPVAPGSEPRAERRLVTPGYFAAMGIPVRRGRVFTAGDTLEQPRVVVINDTLARQFFRGREPLGQQLRAGGRTRTIVGIVSDVKSGSLERDDVGPQIYMPHTQWAWGVMTMVVHTDGDPLTLASAARGVLKTLDPLLPAANMRTMDQVVSRASSARRFSMALLGFFAVAALILTAIGIYGVVAFLVGHRSREIGVRMALGAQPGDILRLVIRQGMKPVALGTIAGLAGSLAASRLVASQLYGVSSSDPLTLVTIAALLAVAALVACWLPARAATKVHPLEALRCD